MVNKTSWKSALQISRPGYSCSHCIPSFDQLGNNAHKVYTIQAKQTLKKGVKYSYAEMSFYCIAYMFWTNLLTFVRVTIKKLSENSYWTRCLFSTEFQIHVCMFSVLLTLISILHVVLSMKIVITGFVGHPFVISKIGKSKMSSYDFPCNIVICFKID